MSHHDNVRTQLHAIEALMRQHQLWRITRRSQTRSPAPNRFVWIRWPRSSGSVGLNSAYARATGRWSRVARVFCRLSLLRNGAGSDHPARAMMLVELEKLDALFAGDDA